MLAEDDSLLVGPNHVFWVSEEEEEQQERAISVPGLGFVGRAIDTLAPGVPMTEQALSGIRVSLIDYEVYAHSAFSLLGLPNLASGPPSLDPLRTESAYHATSVAGALLLAAPGVAFTAVPVTDSAGLADELQIGIAIAGAIPGADLICLPIGGTSHRDRVPVGLASIPTNDAAVIVAAAGNHGSERPFWPAAMPGILAVGATDMDDRVVPWSGRGPWVDLYGPGLAVPTPGPDDRWIQASGTSIAAAMVTAGLARTMAEQNVNAREAATALRADRGGQPSLTRGPRAPAPDATPAPDTAPAPDTTPLPTPASSVSSADETDRADSPLAAGYAADIYDRSTLVGGATDVLHIRSDVDVLASVIASQRIQPPLSIGVFGDWGAGKSFLMNQLRLRVDELADASRKATASYYCGETVQIEFNAWQYADGQLWASLVNRVFEGIRDHLDGDERYRAVMDAIERQDAEVKRAADQLAEAKRAASQAPLPTVDRTVADVAADNPEVKSAVDQFTTALRLEGTKVDLIEVAERTRELRTLGGRLREGWAVQGRGKRALFLSALVAGIALIAAATLLSPISRLLATVAGILGPAIVVISQILKPTGDAFRAGLRILGASEREKQRYAEAKSNYERASAELTALRHQGPGGLYGFVEERYRAEDYRRYLGMIPLIREDLKRLTDFTASSGKGPGIERIVLYIDDLDRCPASQVVHVLEAVNLLFGFPLFVVVVAVDSRWLVQSLLDQFGGVFGASGDASPSPQDYLEKIIQIPFWLRPMRSKGFERLIKSLVPVSPAAKRPAAQRDEAPYPAAGDRGPGHEPAKPDPAQPVVALPVVRAAHNPGVDVVPAAATANATDLGGEGGTTGEGNTTGPAGSPLEDSHNIDLEPDTLVITPAELQFLSQLGSLIDTPRAAKRLVNTYQLVRVSVDDVPGFLQLKEYEPVLVLLALVVGSPGLTAPMVRSLLTSASPSLTAFLAELDAHREDESTMAWLRLKADLARVPADAVTAAAAKRWLPTVSRFSFRPGLVAVADEIAASLAGTAGAPMSSVAPRRLA
ncbi:MAG: P-loop NTPase fold protein [Streptosporangiaceae bacterium]